MKEPSVAGSSVVGSEALSRISGHAGLSSSNKNNGIKESRSPQMVMSTLLHAPGADFDASGLGACFLALAQGSMLLMKATGDRAPMAANLQHFKSYIRSLFGR